MASVAAALVLFSLRNGVQQTVFQGANQTDLKSITVYPQGGGFLKLVKDTAGVPITDATIGEIEQIPGVAMIHRQLLYRGLASLELNILGQTFQTDTLIFGADEGMVNNSGATYKNWGVPVEQYSQPRDVPVVASKKLLDFYNLSLATSGDLPGLSEGMLTGTPISILPGFSSLLATAGTEKPAPVQGQIIAFENNAELLGITVPIDYVFALNKKEGITSPQYSKLRLVLESATAQAGNHPIAPRHLPPGLGSGQDASEGTRITTLEELERQHILDVLQRTGGNRQKTAQLLGIAVSTLYEKLKRLCLDA